MVGRLDAAALVLALFAGTMAIEDSHRLDTGAPDDGLVASPPSNCSEDQAFARANVRRQTDFGDVISVELGDPNDTDAPRVCD